ncbi:hypothetical protein F9U64_14430 [Gracilibacillus oryzae]|uniref:Uncharacterized protein n=1 Tax=Gracilibacillus oryzae TaxID=1672701 RepID=A0A7C8KSY9_9BACI|nr:hypothetical protein [Gracilibacillus oryzae]KAB8130317.1 hypothetical protein F9U64_14430 [Gracilibacillus oryzae]
MVKRISMVLLTLVFAIITLLAAATTGPVTVKPDELVGLMLSALMLVLLFIPLIVLAIFHHIVARIISSFYQSFILLCFLIMIPMGVLLPSSWLIASAVAGSIVSLGSNIITIIEKKGNSVIST